MPETLRLACVLAALLGTCVNSLPRETAAPAVVPPPVLRGTWASDDPLAAAAPGAADRATG